MITLLKVAWLTEVFYCICIVNSPETRRKQTTFNLGPHLRCRRSYYNFHTLQFVTIRGQLCPGFHAAAKIAIFRVLRKIASLTIFRVNCDFSQFFVMLIITEVQGELSI